MAALALLLVAGVVTLARRQNARREPPPRAGRPPPPPVERALEERPTDDGFLGVVLARESVDLVPKMDGRVESMHARLGDPVARGASVATLDTRSIRRDLAMGQAELEVSHTDETKAA